MANYSQNNDGRLKARVKNVLSTLECKYAADVQQWALNRTSTDFFVVVVASLKSYNFS